MTAFYKKLIPGKGKSEEGKQGASSDVLFQLKKIQDQLVYLERKVDQLLAKSGGGSRRFHNRSRGGRDSRRNGPSGGHRPQESPFRQGQASEEAREPFKHNRNFPH